jgi:DtxR family Mn-dependent transcriptional regulator
MGTLQMPSTTAQDYLKAIYVLQEREGRAKTGALANQLGITAGSVTEMIKRMANMSPALITYRQHHGAMLTEAGRRNALMVIRRHRLIETFLHQVLGLDWETVHEEAEVLEHHLSDRLVDAIDRHLDSPRTDPHGEPIPDACGEIGALEGIRLTDLKAGSAFRIVRVDPTLEGMLPYLNELDIGLNTAGIIVSHAPFQGPVTIQLKVETGSRETDIAREVASRLYAKSG